MVSISICVDCKQIKISPHYIRWNISKLINIVQRSLLSQSKSKSLEYCIDSKVRQLLWIANQKFKKIDKFDSTIVVVNCLVCMWDVWMANAVCSGGKLSSDGGVGGLIISTVCSNIVVKMFFSKKARQIVLHADLLNQSNHIVSSHVEQVFIYKRFVLISFNNQITQSIMLSQKQNLKSSQSHIFNCSNVSSIELPIFSNWQHSSRRSLQFSIFERSYFLMDLSSGAIDHTSINPRGELIDICSHLLCAIILRTKVCYILFA